MRKIILLKTTALVLTLAMCLSLLPMSTLAGYVRFNGPTEMMMVVYEIDEDFPDIAYEDETDTGPGHADDVIIDGEKPGDIVIDDETETGIYDPGTDDGFTVEEYDPNTDGAYPIMPHSEASSLLRSTLEQTEVTEGSFDLTVVADCINGYEREEVYTIGYKEYNGEYDITYSLRFTEDDNYKKFDFTGYDLAGWVDENGDPFECKIYDEDVTVYADWQLSEMLLGFKITYEIDPAIGNVVGPSLIVSPGKTIELPTVLIKNPAYRFLYWVDVATGVQWTEDMPVHRNMTLRAELGQGYTVTFDLNGAPGEPPASISLADRQFEALPVDPEWEGHKFLGWYYMENGEQTDRPFTEKFLSTEVVTSNMTLYAKWEEIKSCTVSFDWGKAYQISSIEPAVVEAGTKLTEYPWYEEYYGYAFMGWKTSNGTMWAWLDDNGDIETSGKTVTEDMTLYAVWDPEIEDTFSFGNWAVEAGEEPYFTTYMISNKYLTYLKLGEDIVAQGWIDDLADDEWGGSCFGMSAVYCLKYADRIDPGVFQAGADELFDLERPSRSKDVNDLINYYHLMQMTGLPQYELQKASRHTTSVRNKNLVSKLQETDYYAVISFSYSDGGHAIVGKSIEQDSAGNYHIAIWDNVRPQEAVDGELIISADFSTATFSSDVYNAAEYNQELKVKTAFTIEDNIYDRKNLQDFIQGKTSTYSYTAEEVFALLDVSEADFSVVSNGLSAEVKNGEQVSGDLELTYLPQFDADDEVDGYQFILDIDAADDLTVTFDASDATVKLRAEAYYAAVEADDLTSVQFTENTVKTTCASSAEQTITYVSDTLGSTWNKVTVTGKDTGFSLKAGTEQVTISSDNNVSAKVTGMNVSNRQESVPQTVSVTPAGTSVSTSADSMKAAESVVPSENPFADVDDGAYYYDAVLWAVEKGITNGTSATTFGPNDTCTRAQTVTFLWRAAGSPEPASSTNPFTDVNAGAYYYKAVLWAVEKGITSGTSATTFGPNEVCNRAQTVTFLHRAAGAPVVQAANPFTDVKAGSYYEKPVLWAVANGITNGTSATTFGPNDTCNRGQIVTFLWRFDALGVEISGLEISGQDIANALVATAQFTRDWFDAFAYGDNSDTITGSDGKQYVRVDYPGVSSVKDVLALTLQHYTGEFANQLVNGNRWLEENGKLYVVPFGEIGSVTESCKLDIVKNSDTMYTITVTDFFEGDILGKHDVHYILKDGVWVFDQGISYEYAWCPVTVNSFS